MKQGFCWQYFHDKVLREYKFAYQKIRYQTTFLFDESNFDPLYFGKNNINKCSDHWALGEKIEMVYTLKLKHI